VKLSDRFRGCLLIESFIQIVVPKILRVYGNLAFRLFEHFVEHRNLILVISVPKVRGY